VRTDERSSTYYRKYINRLSKCCFWGFKSCNLIIYLKSYQKNLPSDMSLLKEVKQDRTEKVLELLQGPQDLNAIDTKTGNTLLHLAISNTNSTILGALLRGENKPELNILNKEGLSPLCFAVLQNYEEGVELLLKAGAQVDLPSDEGYTPLHYAAENNSKEILKLLLKAGADINYKSEDGTALHIATRENNDDIAFFLMENPKLNFLEIDEDGNTFLHIAIMFGAYNIFQKFFTDYDNGLYKEVNITELVNHANNDGNTILHLAELEQKSTVADFLRKNAEKYGLNLNAKNKEGMTADDCRESHKIRQQKEEEMKKIEKEELAEARKARKEEREQLAEERRKQEEMLKKKQEEERLRLQAEMKKKEEKKTWIFVLAFVGIIALMYLFMEYAIAKKKENILDL